MNVIGFSSGVVGRDSNADRMVRAVLERSGAETELVKLTDLTFTGCKGCVELCAEPQVCGLEDDLLPHYRKIKEADAVVLGSPVYMGDVNAMLVAFIERFFGYRHVTVAVEGKPFVVVLCGHRSTENALERVQKRLRAFRVGVVDVIEYISETPPCLSCGRHRECCIGGLYRRMGEEAHSVEITPGVFHRWEDCAEAVDRVEQASTRLLSRLRGESPPVP